MILYTYICVSPFILLLHLEVQALGREGERWLGCGYQNSDTKSSPILIWVGAD